MNIDYPSPNFDERPAGTDIDMLVLHYTGLKTLQEALDRLTDPGSKVSAHYLVAENGEIFCLVPEDKRAWHAGVSKWLDRKNLNETSIGIELVNPGHDHGYKEFTIHQYKVLETLIESLIKGPDLLIYLRSGIPNLVNKIHKRGRDYENSISIDYLSRLNERYEAWISTYDKSKLVVIDVDEIDFVEKKKDLKIVLEKLDPLLSKMT